MRRVERQAHAVAAGMVVFHLGCLLVLYTGASAVAVAAAGAAYLARAFGVTAGFHRYFAHRAFKTTRAVQVMLAALGSLAVQGGPLWWVAHHRDHHKHTETERDLHSPRKHGFWQAHIGWMASATAFEVTGVNTRDLHRYAELRFLQQHYVAIVLLQGAVIFAFGELLATVAPAAGTSGLQMLAWVYFVSTVALWHSTFMVNSVCHMWGTAPHITGDDSRNNWIVALLTLGEGWHNNHHRWASSARHGLRWWQLDVTYVGLRLLALTGVVWDLKGPGRDESAPTAAAP